MTIYYPARVDSRLLAEIQQDQWTKNLGLSSDLQAREPVAYIHSMFEQGDFTGVAEDPYTPVIPDPFDLLSVYKTGYPSWSDPAFDTRLDAAAAIPDPPVRMKELAVCEASLLRAMPFVPLYFDSWVYLERPEVHGLGLNLLGVPAFKYAWIDSNRRVQ
jgi:ABC-type oligopeptide transport system substrate-binding subunit